MRSVIETLGKRFKYRQIFRVLGGNRSTYYAQKKKMAQPQKEEDAFVEIVKKAALQKPYYGYRRIAQQLKVEESRVQYKKVYMIMKKSGLLCKRKKKWIRTTDSAHSLRIFPNLAASIDVVGINQLWVADITYCPIDYNRFVYFAAIMDAYSRKIVGWDVNMNLGAELCVNALQMALKSRENISINGLIHHTDRGTQYASVEYTSLLTKHNIVGSMSRKGNPYDNALAESFFKTFKYEALYRAETSSFSEVYILVKEFVNEYNKERLHSSIGYLQPEEFERKLLNNQPTKRVKIWKKNYAIVNKNNKVV